MNLGTNIKTKPLQEQFVLNAEQRVALLEAKVKRAEEQIKLIAEAAKKLKGR